MATGLSKKKDVGQPMFSKEQIVASDRYADKRDLVVALLDDSKKYTYATVDKTIGDFLKGKVSG